MRHYLDNNVLSVYVSRAPASGVKNQATWAIVQDLFSLAKRKNIRFMTSDATTEEAAAGAPSAVASRRVGLRSLTVHRLTGRMLREAERLLRGMKDEDERKRLRYDALHFVAACHLHADVLVTTDADDFAVINGLADKAGGFSRRPNTENPEQTLRRLGIALNPPIKGLFYPASPWLKRIMARVQKAQLRLVSLGFHEDVFAAAHPARRTRPRSRSRS